MKKELVIFAALILGMFVAVGAILTFVPHKVEAASLVYQGGKCIVGCPTPAEQDEAQRVTLLEDCGLEVPAGTDPFSIIARGCYFEGGERGDGDGADDDGESDNDGGHK